MGPLLITTGNLGFWETSGERLFLGEWCRLYDQKHLWEKWKTRVLPYPWDDRSLFRHHFETLQGVYEKYLVRITDSLNQLHGTHHTTRFTRMTVGPWMLFFIPMVFERLFCLETAVHKIPSLTTRVAKMGWGKATPSNTQFFYDLFATDWYNLFLYSRILEIKKIIPFTTKEFSIPIKDAPPKKLKGWAKRVVTSIMGQAIQILPKEMKKIVWVDSSFPLNELQKLQLLLSQGPVGDLFPNPVSTEPFDLIQRTKLIELLRRHSTSSDFELLLHELVGEQLPIAYLEGFADLMDKSKKLFPKKPKAILTASALDTNDAFKVWAGTQVEKGTSLGIVQHGGHYGTGFCLLERNEVELADKYYTWGWKREKCIPAHPPRLLSMGKKLTPKLTGDIAWVLNSLPRYSYRLFSVPIASQMLYFIEEQIRFIKSLTPSLRQRVQARLYPTDYGWNERQRFQDELPDLRMNKGQSFHQQLKESCLFVGTHNTTTYLETLSMNFPTLIYWNPKYWELDEEAQEKIEILKSVKIFHETPESAAAHLIDIESHLMQWWLSADVQKGREIFCKSYCNREQEWSGQWKKLILELSQSSTRREPYAKSISVGMERN